MEKITLQTDPFDARRFPSKALAKQWLDDNWERIAAITAGCRVRVIKASWLTGRHAVVMVTPDQGLSSYIGPR